eukprot:scaffold21543_cov30-Tisochrysis_lutea.AAC.1
MAYCSFWRRRDAFSLRSTASADAFAARCGWRGARRKSSAAKRLASFPFGMSAAWSFASRAAAEGSEEARLVT